MSIRFKVTIALLFSLAGLTAAASAVAQTSPVALPVTLPMTMPLATSPSTAPAASAPTAGTPATPPTRQVAIMAPVTHSWMADKPDYFNPFGFDWNDGKWFVSGYFGVAARSNLSSLLFRFDANYSRQYMVLGTLGREIGSVGNALRFEWEAGLGMHFGHQTFVDAHLYFVARWIWFPWNRVLPTTIAIGTGPSFASTKPDLENEKGEAGRYKNGLMLELTLAPPDSPNWMFAARIHHRSSVFGLLHNGSPSDYVTIGIKHRF